MRIEPLGTHRSKRIIDSRIDVRRGSRCVAGFGLRNGLVQYTPANCLLDELGEVALLHAALSEERTYRDVGLFRDPYRPAYRVIHCFSEIGVLTSRRMIPR